MTRKLDGNYIVSNTVTDTQISSTVTNRANSAANTVRVSGNSASTLDSVSLNFVNTASINVTVTSGVSGNANVALSANTSNPAALGPQGPQGAAGTAGPQGVQGATGPTGPQGVQGALGPQGAVGAQGAQGLKGDQGEFGGATFEYVFNTNTANTDPTSGFVKFNNSTLLSATEMYIDYIDRLNANVFNYLNTIDDSTSIVKGTFKIANTANTLEYAFFNINGSHLHVTDWFVVPVAGLTSTLVGSNFPDSTNVTMTFVRTGDKGDTGSQGPQGVQGSAGTTGPQGPQGVQGATGATTAYIFDGGGPLNNYSEGPAFDCGGVT